MKVDVKLIGEMHGYKLYFSNFLKSNPLAIARSTRTQEYILLAGKSFDLYTDDEREVLFYHEMGHLKYGMAPERNHRDMDLEHRCDVHSAEMTSVERVINLFERQRSMYTSEKILNEIEVRIDLMLKYQHQNGGKANEQ